MNIVIPLAGKSSVVNNQFKPFMRIKGEYLISLIINDLKIKKTDQLIFIILKNTDERFKISHVLNTLFSKKYHIIIRYIINPTKGAPCTILEGVNDLVNNEQELLIELGDVIREIKNLYLDIQRYKNIVSGIIPVDRKQIGVKAWGYVLVDNNGNVKELREKEIHPSSYFATMGLYYFSKGKYFIEAAEKMINKKSFLYNNSFFVGPVYNELIKQKNKVIISQNSIIKIIYNNYL